MTDSRGKKLWYEPVPILCFFCTLFSCFRRDVHETEPHALTFRLVHTYAYKLQTPFGLTQQYYYNNGASISPKLSYLGRSSKVKLFPIQVTALADNRMVGERVTEKVHVLAGNLAGEYVAVLLLSAAQELQRVCAELQGAAQVRDEPIINWWFAWLPGTE